MPGSIALSPPAGGRLALFPSGALVAVSKPDIHNQRSLRPLPEPFGVPRTPSKKSSYDDRSPSLRRSIHSLPGHGLVVVRFDAGWSPAGRRCDSARSGQAAGPGTLARRSDCQDDRARGLRGRIGRQRARHRQSGGDDLRRTGTDLDHRKPGISASRGRTGPRPHQGAGRHRRRRPRRQDHDLCRRPEHSLGHRRRSRRRVGRQCAGHPVLARHRRRRPRRQAGGGRHGFRPSGHARVAQLAHLGARRLAVRSERRVQPLPRHSIAASQFDSPARCSASIRRRATSSCLRRHQQPLGRGLGHRRQRLRQRLRHRPPVAS